MTKGKVLAGGVISIGGLSLLSWSLVTFDIHLHFDSKQPPQSVPGYQSTQPQPTPRQPAIVTQKVEQTLEPAQLKSLSYQECWNLAIRAHSDLTVAVPPECKDAQQEYERKVEEQAAKERERVELEQRARAEAAQQAEYERQRAERQAEENRRRNEDAQRRAEDEQRRIDQERQRKADEMIRAGKGIIDRIRRKN